MKTLQEIREEYAKSCLYNDWEEMYEKQGITDLNLDEIAEIFANEKVNEILEDITDQITMEDTGFQEGQYDCLPVIESYKIKI